MFVSINVLYKTSDSKNKRKTKETKACARRKLNPTPQQGHAELLYTRSKGMRLHRRKWGVSFIYKK